MTAPARLLAVALVAAAAAGFAPGTPVVRAAADAPAAAPAADVPVQAEAVAPAVRYNDPRRAQQWALTRLGAESLRARATAKGVVVAVIDSGVQATHPDLRGRLVPGWDFTTNRPGGTTDGYGHGTHIAGIIAANANNRTGIAGVAPDARIMPLRVLDDRGAGWGSNVAKALRYAADHGAKVANVSLSSRYSAPVASAVAYARSRGVIVVAAAGNARRSGNPVAYPAALPGVIGVGAVDSARRAAAFSGSGSFVDVVAPGVSVVSTYRRSGYAVMSGTSMATPHVSATLAVLVAARPGLSESAATRALRSTARDIGARGVDPVSGAGEIQPVAALCTLVRCR